MAIGTAKNIKVVMEIILPGDVIALNVFYYWTIFTEDQAEYLILDAIKTQLEAMYTEILAEIVDGAEPGIARVYVKSLLGWDLIGSRAPNLTFGHVGSMAPQGVAALVRAYTSEPRVIGRKYLPGFASSALDDGVLITTALSHLAAFAVEWGTEIELSEGNELWPGVYSTVHSVVVVMSGTMVVPVHPGYQRRRRPGVGI